MNDPKNSGIERLNQMLEDATAADASASSLGSAYRAHAPSEAEDAEAASLREAWLAFAQLARAADESLPAINVAMPTESATIVTHKPRQRRWLGAIAAAAAMFLVATFVDWWIVHGMRQQNNEGSHEPSVAHERTPEFAKPQAVKQDTRKPAVAATEKATDKSAATSAWDDPIEMQITSVSQQIRDVEQNWRHRTDDLDLVQYSIDKVSDAVQNDEL